MAWGGECEVGGCGEAELVTHHQRQTELHGSLVHFIIGLAGVESDGLPLQDTHNVS